MKVFFQLLLIFLFLNSCKKDSATNYSAEELLTKSIEFHDPDKKWSSADLNIHIQEPRVGNPYRFSIIKMNNATGEFELIRNRDEHLAKYISDAKGTPKVLFNESETFDTSLIKKYRLAPERVASYFGFYKMMYGLPMTLNEASVESFDNVSKAVFNEKLCHKIDMQLKEPMFSEYWSVFLSEKDFQIIGIEITFPDDSGKGERLYFEKIIALEGMKLTRMRHWHEYSNDEYMGSDIILKAN